VACPSGGKHVRASQSAASLDESQTCTLCDNSTVAVFAQGVVMVTLVVVLLAGAEMDAWFRRGYCAKGWKRQAAELNKPLSALSRNRVSWLASGRGSGSGKAWY